MPSDVLDPGADTTVRSRPSPVALVSASVLMLAAGAVHLAVVPMHLDEFVLFGVFFVVVGVVQAGLAVALVTAPSRRLFLASAMGTTALVGLWLITRTVGLPVGADPGVPEPVGVPDIVCVALEVVSLPVLLVLARRPLRARRPRPLRTPLAAAPVVLLATVAACVGAGAGLAAMPVAFSTAAPGAEPGGVAVTALRGAPGPEPVKTFTLTAAPGVVAGHPVETYNGMLPGPELRVTQGDRVRVTLLNRLPVATTLHWHGVRVPNAEDGVAGLTQDAVAPGASFTYEFVAADPGTFWYHSHQDTGTQIPAGLFGALLVEPPGGRVGEDVEQTVLLHNPADGSSAVAVNGTTGDLHVDARPGQTVRLRVIDAVAPGMDGTAEAPVVLGAPYRVVALDGHDLNGPQPLGPQRISLGMGQRADLVFTVPSAGAVRLVDSRIAGAPSLLQGFFGPPAAADESVTVGTGPPPAPIDPARLPVFDPLGYGAPAPTPAADPATGPPDVMAPVVLDEGPGFHDGGVALVHTINGAASPQVPPIVVHTGQRVRLHMVNDTAEFHPMHLHGHVFSVLAVDGAPRRGSPVHLDTVLVGPHQSVDVAFLADNPGLWMLHCHVLLHASMGMSMTINYAGVSTPFTMGSRSGNTPE